MHRFWKSVLLGAVLMVPVTVTPTALRADDRRYDGIEGMLPRGRFGYFAADPNRSLTGLGDAAAASGGSRQSPRIGSPSATARKRSSLCRIG